MDNSHVALVSVHLEKDSFTKFRCDRPMPLGVNLQSLTKVLKCAKDSDTVKLTASDSADVLKLRFSDKGMLMVFHYHRVLILYPAQARVSNYEMKLMDIDMDELGIPDTEYDATVVMPSVEFGRIVRDLSNLGESVKIEVSKEGVRFSADGEAANGSVLLKQTESVRKLAKSPKKGESSKKTNGKVKKEEDDDEEMDEDKEEDDGGTYKAPEDEEDPKEDEEDQNENDDDEEEETVGKKRKKSSSSSKRACPTGVVHSSLTLFQLPRRRRRTPTRQTTASTSK